MLPRQNILLLGHRHMRINFRHVDGAVSQHLLNIADIHVRIQQTGRKGVAEHMRRDVLLDGGQRSIFVDHSAHRLIGEGISVVVHKEVSTRCSFAANTFVVSGKDLENRLVADLQAALSASFSVDEDGAVGKIHIAYFQGAELGDPHSCGKQKLRDGSIPQGVLFLIGGYGSFVLLVYGGQEQLDCVKGDGFGQDHRLAEMDAYFIKGVRIDDFPIFKIVEECFYGGNLALGCFGLTLSVQPCDILFQNFGGDLRDLRFGSLLTKLAQIDSVGFQCFLIKAFLHLTVFQVILNAGSGVHNRNLLCVFVVYQHFSLFSFTTGSIIISFEQKILERTVQMIDKQTFHPLNYIKKEEYSGSMDGMRYLLKRDKDGEEDAIRVTVWPEPLGIYKTPQEKQTSVLVPLSAEGVEQAADWLNDQYETRKDYWLENLHRPWTEV